MNRCELCQAQLLEQLYDLLDAAELQALQAHLEQCADCRAAQARAQAQQQLLAAAARCEHTVLPFEAPPADTPLPFVRPSRERWQPVTGNWQRWAVAACIWLVLGGLGIAGTGWYLRGSRQEDHVARTKADYDRLVEEEIRLDGEHVARLSQSNQEWNNVQQEIRKLEETQTEELKKTEKAVKDSQMYVVITGPQILQPGGSNEFRIETNNLNNKPVPAQITARVLDQNGTVVYQPPASSASSTTKYRMALPRDLPLKPNTQLSLEVIARAEGGREAQLRERLTLGKPVYVTHLTTDKPMYQPGETVHFRSLTLERFSLKPPTENLQLVYSVITPSHEEKLIQVGQSQLRDAQNRVVNGADNKPIQGVGASQFVLPPNLSGGEYTLRVRELGDRFPIQERKFIVNRYQKARLHKEVELTRRAYGPGDEVVAVCKVSVAQGGLPLIGKPVTATLQVDGQPCDAQGNLLKNAGDPKGHITVPVDAGGGATLRLKLPARIERGEASLAVTFTDGGAPETLVKPVPVVLKKLDVEFFPEGGDLVAGVPNRVYFQARTPLGKPADLKGRIVDPAGNVAAAIQTLTADDQPGVNQGMGAFEFEPEAGTIYELKIDSPPGIEGQYLLPNVTADGVALRIPTGLSGDQEPIRVIVRSAARDRQLLVGAYCRGRLLDHRRVLAKKGEATETLLQPDAGIGGVYRVTVFEERPTADTRPELLPVAERLVYRQPAGRLNVAIKPDRKDYSPRDKATLHLSATNEKGQPAPAILLVSVVDKTVLNMADEKTARSMPTHFFLTSEVRRPEDLEHADFMLGEHPLAAKVLDLLLGTQGWRRFAEQGPGEFKKEYKQDAERLLVTIGQMAPVDDDRKPTDPLQQELGKVAANYKPRFQELQEQLLEAQEKLDTQEQDSRYAVERQRLEKDIARAGGAYASAVSKLQDFESDSRELRSRGLLALAAVLLLLSVAALLTALLRGLELARPYLVTGVSAMALCALVVVATFIDIERHTNQAIPTAELRPFPRWKYQPIEGPIVAGGSDAADRPQPDLGRWSDSKTQKKIAATNGRLPLPTVNAAPVADQAIAPTTAPIPPQPSAESQPTAPRAEKAAAPREQFEYERLRILSDGKDADKDAQANLSGMRGLYRGRRDANLDELAAGENKGEARESTKSYEMQLSRQLSLWDRAEGRRLQNIAPAAGKPMAAGQPAIGGGPANYLQRHYIPPPPPPFVVREYAHQRKGGAAPTPRSDYTETLYWHPVLVLPNGEAQVSFQLSDSLTSFQVAVAGHTTDGRIGAASTIIESKLPFSVDPKLPIEVTRTDKLIVPVTIANDTEDKRRVDVRMDAQNLSLTSGSTAERLEVGPNQRARRSFHFQPSILEGDAQVTLTGISEPFATDKIQRKLKVVPDGFPVVRSYSDLLEKAAQHRITLPARWVPGTLKLQVNVYPSTLADLQQGLEAMLREPHGCFEQTSTSNYPNLLVLDYLKTNDQARPEVARRALDLLDRGYQRLISFECKNPDHNNQREGFEWFGGNVAPHEALTAYGLMQFRDMARVYNVDQAMLERTRKFLMSRKDGNGGFLRKKDHHSFGNVTDQLSNAYIVWALTESGPQDDLKLEMEQLVKQAQTSEDPYFLALVANSLLNRAQEPAATALLRKLARKQKQPEGVIEGAQTSITQSSGRDLQIETTALTLLAWSKLNRPEFVKNVQAAVKWLGQQRGGYGGYGSTQATILCLKALLAYTTRSRQTAEPGELALFVGGQRIKKLDFKAGVSDTLTLALDKPEELLRAGDNDVRIEITGKSLFPYTLTWSYADITPPSAKDAPVKLSTRLNRGNAGEEDRVQLTATVSNESGRGQGMAVAIIGLPGGLSLPDKMEQLQDLVKEGRISYWELRGRELILYWRGLAKDQKVEVTLDLLCKVPGEYSGPASRAYLYYNADRKHWVEPLQIEIAPRVD